MRAPLRRSRRRRDVPLTVAVAVIVASAMVVMLEHTVASHPTTLAMAAVEVGGGTAEAAVESGRGGERKTGNEEEVESGARLAVMGKYSVAMVEGAAESGTGARSKRDGRTGGGAAITQGATVFGAVRMAREGGMALEVDVVTRRKKDLRPLPERSCHPSAELWPWARAAGAPPMHSAVVVATLAAGGNLMENIQEGVVVLMPKTTPEKTTRMVAWETSGVTATMPAPADQVQGRRRMAKVMDTTAAAAAAIAEVTAKGKSGAVSGRAESRMIPISTTPMHTIRGR